MTAGFRYLLKAILVVLFFSAFSAFAQFENNLTVGSRGEDVKKIQEFLIRENVYPEKLVTGYFGQLTKAAVIKFQEKYEEEILKPLGLKSGTGFFGLMSRKKANEISGITIKAAASNFAGTFSPAPAVFKSYKGVDDYSIYGSPPTQSFGEASPTPIELGENFEISLLLKTNSAAGGMLVGRIDPGGAYEQYWLLEIAVGGNGGKIEAAMGNGPKSSSVYSSVRVDDGGWHKIVWVRSGDQQTISVDGIDRTAVNFIDSGIGDVNPSTKIYIGADVEGGEKFFKGDIGDVKIILR